MKRCIILGALLVSAITYADAKVGDSIAQTNQLFGKPIRQVEGGKVYMGGKDGFVIVCFDPSGICQAVAYMKINGVFSDADAALLDSTNLPANSGEWTEAESDMPGYRFWTSPNVSLYVASASFSYGNQSIYMRAYVSPSGAFLMQSVGEIMSGGDPKGVMDGTTPKANTQSAPHAANKY